MPEQPTAEDISALLHSTPFRFSDEKTLQDKIEILFQQNKIPYTREVALSPRDRIDFMSGTIGIEVKVDSASNTVLRQLWRYAADERISSLILVTTRSKHKEIAREILGKPVIVVYLLASIF